MMGSGVASGEDRAEEAAEMAISSPLLEDIDLSGARGVLVNITAGFDLRLDEFEPSVTRFVPLHRIMRPWLSVPPWTRI